MENTITMKHKIIIKPQNVSGSLYVGFQSTFKKKKKKRPKFAHSCLTSAWLR